MQDFDLDNEIDFLYEYVFVKTSKTKFSDFSDEIQQFLLNTRNIHLYQIQHRPFEFEDFLHSNIFIYSFNHEMDNHCLDKGYIPHFCFNKDDLLSNTRVAELKAVLEIDTSLEVFWFPSKNEVTNQIEPFMNIIHQLKLINTPICISFSRIFGNPLDLENYSFLEKILKAYKNPLFIKEKELLEYETFSKNNFYIDDTENTTIKIQNIILGLYGDEVLSSNLTQNINNNESFEDNIKKLSKSILQQNKECIMCENFKFCTNRGIGIIAKNNEIKKCLGISLLNKT